MNKVKVSSVYGYFGNEVDFMSATKTGYKGFDGINLESLSTDELSNRQWLLLALIDELGSDKFDKYKLTEKLLRDSVYCLAVMTDKFREMDGEA